MSFCSSKVNRKSENSQFTKEENDQEKLTTLWSRTLRSTTSVLTATVLVYAAGAGITAAARTRLAFQSILIAVFGYSIHRKLHSPDRACGVTTFRRCLANTLYWHWTICAPAAYLSSGGHLSGPLSGVEPGFSVTRHSHCGPLHHNRQLIGQKFATATQNAFFSFISFSLPRRHIPPLTPQHPINLVATTMSYPSPPIWEEMILFDGTTG